MARVLAGTTLFVVVAACSETTPTTLPDPTLHVVLGDSQVGVVGRQLPTPVVVQATGMLGQPIAGVVLRFMPSGGSASETLGTTDSAGYALTYWTLGPDTAGAQTLTASVNARPDIAVTATAEARAYGPLAGLDLTGPAPNSVILPGDTVTVLATPRDAFGSSVPATVTWSTTDSAIALPLSDGRIVAQDYGTTQVVAWARDSYGNEAAAAASLGVADHTSVWVATTSGSAMYPPAVAEDGRIYVRSATTLYALSPTGAILWSQSAGSNPSAPTIDGAGNLYLMAGATLRSLDPGGGLRWSRSLPVPLSNGSPALGPGDTLYFAIRDTVMAVTSGGTPAWHIAVTGFGNPASSPAVAPNGTVHVVGQNGCLLAITPPGSLAWQFCGETTAFGVAPAIGADGTVYFGAGQHFYAVRPNGVLRWRYHAGSLPSASAAVGADGTVYFTTSGAPSAGGGVYALWPNGTLRWFYPLPYTASPPVLGTRGTIYVGRGYGGTGTDGLLVALNPDGTLLWTQDVLGYLSGSGTLTADSLFVIGTSNGTVHAFRVGEGLATSPWPKFQRDLRNRGFVPP